MPSDFHLVHLGGKALGGAALVMTEMVCVSAGGADHPGLRRACTRPSTRRPGGGSPASCTASPTAKIGLQLGHSGRKGSTKLMWEGIDEPLPDGQLAGLRPVADPLPARRQPGAAAS